jgi:DNA-3-methyladenine glycosylase II
MTETSPAATIVGMLDPRPPFSFAHALAFLRRFPPTEGERPVLGEAVLGATRVGGRTIGFRVEDAGTVAAPALRCTLHADDGQSIDDGIVEAALDQVGGWLGIDDDLGPFYALARTDPPFAQIVERTYGYHQVRFFTPFENACWAILGQRTPFAVARRAKHGLATRYGGTIIVDGTACTAFPDASDLASADPSELQGIVGSERKATRLLAIARAFASAEPAFLATTPADRLAEWLAALPGIGPWSVSFILLRGFGRPDTPLPISHNAAFDREILGAARTIYGADLTVEQLSAIAERYGTWRGYWGHYLRSSQ